MVPAVLPPTGSLCRAVLGAWALISASRCLVRRRTGGQPDSQSMVVVTSLGVSRPAATGCNRGLVGFAHTCYTVQSWIDWLSTAPLTEEDMHQGCCNRG